MLLTEFVDVKWNAKTKKHYVDLGYQFTKMGDTFEVKVKDVTKGSNVKVLLKCDYCGKEYEIAWYTYINIHNKNIIDKDACKDCCEVKCKESIEKRYGSYSNLYYASNESRSNTNIEKYGCENVFSNKGIQEKIMETNIKKYGFKSPRSNQTVKDKAIKTCMEKYGVDNYARLMKGVYIKENSPNWKGGVEHSRAERSTYEYNKWRSDVFSKDNYTCVCCGDKSKVGHSVELNAHHILNWKDNIDSRYDINNGITLCVKCHNKFHSIYGKTNTNKEQFEEFINNKPC